MTNHLTFLSHFVLCLAVAAAAFFAALNGVFQTIYASDLSHMTSVLAALFVGSAAWLGWQAWRVDASDTGYDPPGGAQGAASFGHLAERLCVMAGLAGTTIGLSLQATALMSGAASFGALSTSLYTTASGVVAAALIAVLTHNLESGIGRRRR
jgi:hypothetical protein